MDKYSLNFTADPVEFTKDITTYEHSPFPYDWENFTKYGWEHYDRELDYPLFKLGFVGVKYMQSATLLMNEVYLNPN